MELEEFSGITEEELTEIAEEDTDAEIELSDEDE